MRPAIEKQTVSVQTMRIARVFANTHDERRKRRTVTHNTSRAFPRASPARLAPLGLALGENALRLGEQLGARQRPVVDLLLALGAVAGVRRGLERIRRRRLGRRQST